ncbi:hypothetical protein MUK42_20232 [Musa troglodytarum]|nr:hypothetical protein MUK42_20232 [Musa troglodytarum]
MAQCVYQYGDGYGKPNGIIEDRIRTCKWIIEASLRNQKQIRQNSPTIDEKLKPHPPFKAWPALA